MTVFDHATEKADVWLKDMMRELGTDDPRLAYHALSAALQTTRDRLPVEEAAKLASQLPLLVRGLFYEGWHPASTPVHARTPQEIFALFRQKSRDDGHEIDPERALTALLETLERHVSRGELLSLSRSLAVRAR
jgi:uncharacterized protein (DUF2267 family)